MMYDETGQMLLGRKRLSPDSTNVEFVCWGTERSLPIIRRVHHETSGESMFIQMGPVEWRYVILSRDDYGYFYNSRGERKEFVDFVEALERAESASWATALISSGDIECPQTKDDLLELEADPAWGAKFVKRTSKANASIE